MISALYLSALLSAALARGGAGLRAEDSGGDGGDRCTCEAFLPSSTFPVGDLALVEQAAAELAHKLELETAKAEDDGLKLAEYAERIAALTAKVERMEREPDDYSEADFEEVMVEIKQAEALNEELQVSIKSSAAVFVSMRVQVTAMVETLDELEKTYDRNLVLKTRREYLQVALQLEECERRHQELFNPNIGSCAHAGIAKIGKPVVSQLNAHLSAGYKYGGWGKDSKPAPDRKSMYWYSGSTSAATTDIRLYADYKNLILRNSFRHHTLQSGSSGLGNNYIFRDNALYYQTSGKLRLGKLNFTTMKYESRAIPGASAMFSYLHSPNQNLDFAADESGLWVTYATVASGGLLVLAKINEGSLEVEETWQTSVYKPGVSNAFMVCGVLYVVRVVDTVTEEVFYKYDVRSKRESYTSIPFERFQEKYSYLDYNPADQKLYMYNDGYYVTYHLWFNHTAQATVIPPFTPT